MKLKKIIKSKNYLINLIGITIFGLIMILLISNNYKNFRNHKILNNLKTDLSKSSVNLDDLVENNLNKNESPELINPKLIPISDTEFEDDMTGILFAYKNSQVFYPLSILYRHQIINDGIEDLKYIVTFCSVCMTGIVYESRINSEDLIFKKSNYLYDSNLVMYDSKTSSLWSQARGKAIVGEYSGLSLEILPFEQIKLGQAKKDYPNALIMSTDTGYDLDYSHDPFLDLNEVEDADGKVISNRDPMYVVPFEEVFLVIPVSLIAKNADNYFHYDKNVFSISVNNGRIEAKRSNGEVLVGFYQMRSSINKSREDIVFIESLK